MSSRPAGSDAPAWMTALSPGAWIIAIVAALSTFAVAVVPDERSDADATMWASAKPHFVIYDPIVKRWNDEPGAFRVKLELLSRQVLDRRMVGGFLGGVPVSDVLEVERATACLAFAGPLDAVGFLDLTDRLEADGLLGRINPPSLTPWTYQGRVFGIPHDVHPVMLGYRADLVEAAGISLDGVETWDDLFARLRPLQHDGDGDGIPDRYVLSLWDTSSDMIEAMILQSGGGNFLPDGTLAIDREENATAVAEIVSWMVGHDRVATDVPDFNPRGNVQKLRGDAVCYLFPDWMCDIWKEQLPQLSGSMRLMPLPAWEPGGRRTSVWGGSMIGINREADNHDELWEFAKRLYATDEVSREMYREGDIIPPFTALWDDPIFDEPDSYFGGQPKGRMYIELAAQVPPRPASPYYTHARAAVQSAVSRLREWAEVNRAYSADALLLRPRRVPAAARRPRCTH
ncbi:MAG: ABC transporter substrate-binding protein, partial [Planctomycetota bacterium]